MHTIRWVVAALAAVSVGVLGVPSSAYVVMEPEAIATVEGECGTGPCAAQPFPAEECYSACEEYTGNGYPNGGAMICQGNHAFCWGIGIGGCLMDDSCPCSCQVFEYKQQASCRNYLGDETVNEACCKY